MYISYSSVNKVLSEWRDARVTLQQLKPVIFDNRLTTSERAQLCPPRSILSDAVFDDMVMIRFPESSAIILKDNYL